MQAAACRTRPPAAPLDTKPASAPVCWAMILPAASFSSSSRTMAVAASFIASSASGRSLVPPLAVLVPPAWITGVTPIALYTSPGLPFGAI